MKRFIVLKEDFELAAPYSFDNLETATELSRHISGSFIQEYEAPGISYWTAKDYAVHYKNLYNNHA